MSSGELALASRIRAELIELERLVKRTAWLPARGQKRLHFQSTAIAVARFGSRFAFLPSRSQPRFDCILQILRRTGFG